MKKLLTSLLAGCVLLCCAACNGQDTTVRKKNRIKEETEPSTVITVPSGEAVDTVPEAPPEEIVPEGTEPVVEQDDTPAHFRMYQELVNDYGKLVSFRLSESFEEAWVAGGDLPALSNTIEQALSSLDDGIDLKAAVYELPIFEDTEEDFGYVLHDLNDDGMPELFWVRSDRSIVAVFTVFNDEPRLLDAYWSRYRGYVGDNNSFYTWGADGAATSECEIFVLQSGKFQSVFHFGTDERAEGQYFYEGIDAEPFGADWDRFEALYETYPDTESTFWQLQSLYPLDHPVTETLSAPEKQPEQLPYLKKIQRADMSVWSGPGYDYYQTGVVEEVGTFTIVAEVGDYDGNLWGLLKSGIGWVDLTLIDAEKVQMPMVTTNYADSRLLESGNYHYLKASDSEYTVQVAFRAHETLKNFELYDDVTGELLTVIELLEPEKPFVAALDFPGDMSMYDIRFTNERGETYYYAVATSGRNNSLEFFEFVP